MSQVNGVVKRILTTPWGDKLLHGFILENDERMFGTGLFQVRTIVPGVNVEFTTEKNNKGRWTVDPKTVVVKQQVRAPEVKQTKEEKDEYWEKKDRVIELQSCRNSAIDLANLIVTQALIKVPTKADEKYDFVLALVDELQARFVTQNDRIRNPEPEEPALTDSPNATNESPEDGVSDAEWTQ